jgi:alkylation response protein AidB-like acyl-CoA dehydrogenase
LFLATDDYRIIREINVIDFSRTDEQELLLGSLREVVKQYGSETYIAKCEEKGEYPVQLHEALHEAGFTLLGAPEEVGGTPCDMVTFMMFHEEFARVCSGAYAVELAAIAMTDMIKFGSKKQLQESADAIKELKSPFCLGFSEPEAGSDSSAITTIYRKESEKIIVSGHKTFITRADRANNMLCIAKNSDVTPDKVFTTLWISMDSPGITITPIPKFGWHMLKSCDVYLDNIEIPIENIVGEEGKGFINVMKNFEIERIVMAAIALGEAELAYEDALTYAKQRIQFGKPIGGFQLIQQRLVDMYTKIENMRHLVYKTAWLEDQGLPINTYAAVCKHYCADASFDVINSAIQILGGVGYSSEVRLSRVLANNRVCGIGGGTQEIMVHVAGRALQKEYKVVE